MRKETLGGGRLGSGGKMKVGIHGFSRSNHNPSRLWKSTMAAGTLVPFWKFLALPGDSIDVNLDVDVKTLPTLGPLFGSFKLQVDVFQVPWRLYNAKMHMNQLNIGMDMSEVKAPVATLWGKNFLNLNGTEDLDNRHTSPSSIWAYLGIRGNGHHVGNNSRNFNAIPYLAYFDIFKNYYANKQEDNAYIVHKRVKATTWTITTATHVDGDDNFSALPVGSSSPVNIEPFAGSVVRIVPTRPAGQPVDPERITVDASTDGVGYNTVFLSNIYQSYTDNGTVIVYSNPVGSPVYTHFDNVDIDTSISVDLDKEPDLVAFPLENIDTMRENILKHFSTAAYEIDDTAISPYGLPLEVDAGFTVSSKEFPMEGLLVKTYGSDLFHNWINTEWIDGAQGIAARTAVDTTGDNFTIDSLNLARKIYDLLNRIAVSGGSGDDWQEAVFDHERKGSIEKPVFLGGLSQAIAFQEIVSTAEANDPLGTLAGRGTTMGDQKGGRISVNVHEPSYLIGIVSITPRVDYSQGNDWDVNLESWDDLHKPNLDQIGFQNLIADQMHWISTQCNGSNTKVYQSVGKQPAWINYMTDVNRSLGNFAVENDSMFMTLNRRYGAAVDDDGQDADATDLTTYVDPAKYNYIFADTRRDAQNFWVQIATNVKARRKMSAKIIPNL